MKVAVVLPRGMHFSPQGATSIDAVARDLMLASRYRETSFIVGQVVANPFDGVDFRPVGGASQSSVVTGSIALLKAEAPDVIVVHQHPESAARIAKALSGTPVLLHRHGLLRQNRNPLSKWRKERRFRHISSFVFVSDFLRQRFLTSFPRYRPASHVIHNAIDTDVWSPSTQKTRTIVFAGRARPDKGIGELIEAFRPIHAPGWQLVLLLAAQTNAEKAYADALTDSIGSNPSCRMVLNATLQEVRSTMARASIAAVPSLVEEGFPRAAIEAMACGCAMITSNRGGLPEATGGHALSVERPDAEALRLAIQQLIDDEAYRSRLAGSGRRFIEDELNISTTSSQYDRLLEHLATTRTDGNNREMRGTCA